MRRSQKTRCLTILLALTLCGCTMVGPNYRRPSAPLEDQWLEYEDPRLATGSPVTLEWWKTSFRDPVLDHLVEVALCQNLSLRSAGLRVLQARQQLAIAFGGQFPQVQQLTGEAGIEGMGGSLDEFYDLGLTVGWEADVWGRFRRQIESASASLQADVASFDGVLVSLIADVAQSYLLIRTTQQRISVARQNLSYQAEGVRITTAKNDLGEVSALDVDQAQTLLYDTQASVAALEQSLQQIKNSLAILLGKPPHDLGYLLGAVRPVPAVPPRSPSACPRT